VAVDAPALAPKRAPRRLPGRSTARPTWLWSTVTLTVAAFVLAVVAAPHSAAPPWQRLTWLLFVGSSGHIASTGWLFSFREVRAHAGRHRTRYVAIPLMLVVAASVTAGLLSPRGLAVVLLGYFGWQFFHYQKQNLGLAALAATSLRVTSLTRVERLAIMATGWSGIAALILRPGTLQLPLHRLAGWYPDVALDVATAAFVASIAIGCLALLVRRSTDRPIGYCAIYLVALVFPLPIFVFSSPYAAVGGMTIAHGLQYLVLVGMVTAGPAGNRASLARTVTLSTVALVAATGLSAASHLHAGGHGARLIYGAYLGVVMSHFVVDAGVWRLRDAFPRRFISARLPSLMSPTPSPATDASSY
jgi:hypothetical protein